MNSLNLVEKDPHTGQSSLCAGSEMVVRALIAEGVDTIFGYPGGAIMPVYDALFDHREELVHFLTRHEQGAVHAAQGYARVKGKAGVCLATSGPGATNLLTGLADAKIDSTPLVCITGQVHSDLLGTDAFQETDVISISRPVTKWNCQVTRAEDIPAAVAKAFFIAQSGRPGPVLLDITKDAQVALGQFQYEKCREVRSYKPVPPLDETVLEEAALLLNQSQKPFLIWGQGVLIADAQAELQALIEKTGIPAASTILGLSALPTDHPNYVGLVGMHGNYGPNLKTNECDVLLAVGMRFDDRVTGNLAEYAKQAKVIHIDIDPAEIGKNVPTEVAILADAKEALGKLAPRLEPREHKDWTSQFRERNEEEFKLVTKAEAFPEDGKIRMAEVVRHLSEQTGGEAILVTDVGQHQMVANRGFDFRSPNSNITSGGLGTMGFALPAAMGAQLAAPKKQVLAVIGDGGFQMTFQELGTIMQYDIPVKILVLNNEYLGMVRQWQELFYDGRYSSVEMVNPDFVQIVKGFNIPAERVKERSEIAGALERMLSAEGSYFLEVVVEKETNVFPMVPAGASVSEMRLQ